MFGISIFREPEHFVALALSVFQKKKQAIQELQNLLHRTKNPPISIIYTLGFLRDKSAQEYGLDIIRFISQLSDLSEGYSVSTSLKDVIGESSFLTEIRHNLTHKTMVSKQLIDVAKELILKDLDEKYWQVTLQKYSQTFDLDRVIIQQHYERIYGEEIEQKQLQVLFKFKKAVTKKWLIEVSTPYEFKEFFLSYFNNNIKNAGNIDSIACLQFISCLSEHKKAIALSKMICEFIKNNKDEEKALLLSKILRKEGSNLLKQPLILHQLKKLAFVHYLGLCGKILNSLDETVKTHLSSYWTAKQQKIEKISDGRIKNIYNVYKPL